MRNIVAAADKPVAGLLASRKDAREREEARKLAGIQLGESMAERQLKKDIAGMKSGVDLLPTFLDLYEGNLTLAQNRNSYEKSGLQTRAKNAFGKNFAGLVGGDRHGDIESKTFKNKKNVGKVYYDIEDAQFKRIRKTPDGFGVEIIDINTFSPEADAADNTVQLSDFAIETNKAIEERRKIKEEEEKRKRNELLSNQPDIDPFQS